MKEKVLESLKRTVTTIDVYKRQDRGPHKLIILSDLSPAIIQLYGAYINNLEGELLNLRLLSCIALIPLQIQYNIIHIRFP